MSKISGNPRSLAARIVLEEHYNWKLQFRLAYTHFSAVAKKQLGLEQFFHSPKKLSETKWRQYNFIPLVL